MTMQKVYASYVEKAGSKFLNEAGNSKRVQEIKENFERFCGVARTKVDAKVLESVEMI